MWCASCLRRTWVAFDTTYFTGGRLSVNNGDLSVYFGNFRFGATFGMVLGRRQSLKISYFKGAVARFGSDIDWIGIAYNVILIRGRR